MSVTVKLSKPLTAHGEEVTEITLRQPIADDVMQIGVPQLLIPSADGESVGIEVRAKLIGQYITRLGSIPPSSVKQMALGDFQRCQAVVMSFFAEGDGEG